MSELPQNEGTEIMQQPELTDEEIAVIEAERKAEFDAKIAPYKALKERMDSTSNELTDLQLALVDVYETILAP
ncbi:MAG: hypothetical protein ACOX63_03005 [Christensenellales bacterium]|jgi:hypothetical protein